jgi:Zn-dependent peptidase ImmA (M78 family)/DNA-binding XRE family transcriptional regulator
MNASDFDSINPRELGRRLQIARQERGLTQKAAAGVIEVARTTLTAIEKGERRIKAGELLKLAQAYGRDVSDFVRTRPEVRPFSVQFRGPLEQTDEEKQAIQRSILELQELCQDYLELERIMDAPLIRKYPEEYKIKGLPVDRAAEMVALQERSRLGLGDGPLPRLRDILEREVGLRIFYIPIYPTKFSEIYNYDHEVGGCMAINVLHPEERRRWSMSHGYAHFAAQRHKPEVLGSERYQRKPESERFADAFAPYFLMPTSGLVRQFSEVRRAHKGFQVADLCTLAYYYGVSVQALSIRLEELELLPTGTWDRLKQRGFKVREAQSQLDLQPISSRDERLPLHYQHLAIEALDQGRITEGQFARFMRMDRLEARRIAEILREHSSGETDESIASVDLSHPVEG